MRQIRTRGVALVTGLALALAWAQPAPAADPSAEDTDAIAALQSQGVDLSEPQLVEFMFSFQAAQQARQVGKTLAKEGFESSIETAGGKDVLLLARKRVVLNAQGIAELRARFEALAQSAGGQYEGWGIP